MGRDKGIDRASRPELPCLVGDLGHKDWNYHERRDRGVAVISHWIEKDKVSIKACASLERALDQLRPMPKTLWSKPAPASNIGNHTYVIRFRDVGNVQLRIFGHFYDAHSTFVMTANGTEKDNVYYPTNYAEIAKRYKAACDKEFSSSTVAYLHYCEVCKQ